MADEVTEIPRPTSRTTAKKKAADIPEFKTKKKHTYKFKAFDKVWDLKRPNQAKVSLFVRSEDMGELVEYLQAHVVKDQRDDFLKAMLADEDFELEDALALSEKLAQTVYGDIPTNPS